MELATYFTDFTRRDWEVDDPDGTVRVAIAGVGEFARTRAIPAIDECRYCTPTVLVSSSDVRDVANTHDIETVLTYDGFLAGEAADLYDAVYVATPNATHADQAVAAARRGKHVICEKPIEATAAEARRIVDAARNTDVVLMTAYRLQLEPAVRRTRELVHDRAIGDVVQVHAGFSHPILAYTDPGNWRFNPALSGGGALIDLGIYSLNIIRFLLDTDPIAATATTHSVEEIFAEVDEHVAFQLEFPGPTMAACTASFNAHAASSLELLGTEGRVRIASPFGGVVPKDIYVESGDVGMEHNGPPVDEVREEFAYFGYCVLTGTTPEPDGMDGLADVVAIESIYEAASGQRVPIEID